MADLHPLSYNQELMLAFGAEVGFGASRWNHQVIIDLRDYDDADVGRVLHQLFRRHAILRTRIGLRENRHCQVVDELPVRLPHRVADMGHTCPDAVAKAELARPFDLYACPLLRSVAVPRADGGAWLILTLNHLISDRESEIKLAAEFAHRYERAGSPGDAEAAPNQYADFARWQRAAVARYLRDPTSAPQWLEYESMVRALEPDRKAPTSGHRDTASPPPEALRREMVVEFTTADMAIVTAYCRSRKVTLNMAFLAALATATVSVPHLTVGLLLGETTTRYPYRFADTLGPFPDLWPISPPAAAATDFPTVLSSVRNQLLRVIEFPLPFHVLVARAAWLAQELRNDRRAHWIFYQYFNEATSQADQRTRVAGVDFPDVFGEQSSIFGIHLQLRLREGLLRGRLNYHAGSLNQHDMVVFVDGIRNALQQATGQPLLLPVGEAGEHAWAGRETP
ncbi:condensation domain-containing protein [Frankia sp. Cr2]|uniref:condensation domain-containing protein n=1 Tax=Frankia sp. Cr2 TaxID=3073932 RepID=UPI002AD1F3AB|nr:condensation domain-containing protein [Frankia sp. Cr2]